MLQTGFNWDAEDNSKTHTVHLEYGERVIGYNSRSHPDYPSAAMHYDLQLIIGRLI